jgi:hypothetical protein
MKRQLWQQSLSRSTCPPWPCSICKSGVLVLVPKSLSHEETVSSSSAHSHDAFEPDWIEYAFMAWAQCSNAKCKQKYAISGRGGVTPEVVDDEGSWSWEDFFDPKHCFPALRVIEIPAACPENVVNELEASFELFWINPAACAGRIRVALEHLMNHMGVPKRRKKKDGSFHELSLHGRIEAFAGKDKTSGSHLMALKWLGNAGSHEGGVKADDLLDAFEVLEHVLQEVIDGKAAKISKLARKLLKAHGKK